MRFNIRWAYALSALVAGCNTLDEPACDDCEGETRIRRIVPTDERQSIVQAVRPPPVSGGTLLVTADAIVVSDPDRDRVVIVDPATFQVRSVVALAAADEPGRLAEGKDGRVYVALRGSGSVLDIDPKLGTILSRTAVCGEPRGLAFDAVRSLLLVACAEGALVELDGTVVVKRTTLGPDLRDVVVRGSDVYVSRFRSAAILKLDAERNVISESRPPSVEGAVAASSASRIGAPAPSVVGTFEAAVAWRMIPAGAGVMMVHQRATSAVVEIDPASRESTTASPYGGGSGCEGIVRSGVSMFDGQGAVTTSQGIARAVLPVDIAVSPDGKRVAIASAGPADPLAPVPSVSIESADGSGAVGGSAPAFGSTGLTVLEQSTLMAQVDAAGLGGCAFPQQPMSTESPTIAVAFDATGRLYAQTREPSVLVRFTAERPFEPERLPLGGGVRLDTGHELFHRDGGAGIACASCHPEGGEDGRVWHFDVSGERRTQPLDVGIGETAPFHWDGDLADFGSLMNEVFVGRMNGVFESKPRIDALAGYLFALGAPTPVRAPDDPAALRGRIVFESAQVGCASCHSGPKLTDSRTVGVGKGKPLQVPSLVGISRRAPYLHDGCAATLADRFDPSCGGSAHGDVSQLGPEAFSDLIAYLESL